MKLKRGIAVALIFALSSFFVVGCTDLEEIEEQHIEEEMPEEMPEEPMDDEF